VQSSGNQQVSPNLRDIERTSAEACSADCVSASLQLLCKLLCERFAKRIPSVLRKALLFQPATLNSGGPRVIFGNSCRPGLLGAPSPKFVRLRSRIGRQVRNARETLQEISQRLRVIDEAGGGGSGASLGT
jgi:hypothetical protein